MNGVFNAISKRTQRITSFQIISFSCLYTRFGRCNIYILSPTQSHRQTNGKRIREKKVLKMPQIIFILKTRRIACDCFLFLHFFDYMLHQFRQGDTSLSAICLQIDYSHYCFKFTDAIPECVRKTIRPCYIYNIKHQHPINRMLSYFLNKEGMKYNQLSAIILKFFHTNTFHHRCSMRSS